LGSRPDARLDRSFFARPAPVVAPELLGCILVAPGGASIRINETEAYTQSDPASHSFRGQTKRNSVMFGPPGFLYVYFTYGMHWCANVSTGSLGDGEAVLIRGGDIEAGHDLISSRRPNGTSPANLTNGPAKLCQALGIAGEQNGIDLCGNEEYWLGAATRKISFIETPRIGISQGRETLWRFVADGTFTDCVQSNGDHES
jgi:DNA-3-methyladenine glycosylase